MQSLTYPYYPFPIIDSKTKKTVGTIYRPMIPIRLFYNHKKVPFPIDSLVDSGSDTNVFPAQWAQLAGINLTKGSSKKIIGIGGSAINAYTHRVTLYIGTHAINVDVDFSPEQQMPLLGRSGFFNQFKEIKFIEAQKEIILNF